MRHGEVTGPARLSLTALALGGAAIHLALAPAHAGGAALLGAGFVAAAWTQAAVAAWLLARPTRGVLVVGAAIHMALVGAWVISRVAGLPIGPDAWVPEPVGTADLLCVGVEVGWLVVAEVVLHRRSRRHAGRQGRVAVVATVAAVVLATSAAIASPSEAGHQEPTTAHAHVVERASDPSQAPSGAEHLAASGAHDHPGTSDVGTAEGLFLASAMFILPTPDYPIPDVGGSLTPWHSHGDLCFRRRDEMVIDMEGGACPAGSVVFASNMLHLDVGTALDRNDLADLLVRQTVAGVRILGTPDASLSDGLAGDG